MSVKPVFKNKFNYHIKETNGFSHNLVIREMTLKRPMMMGATAYLINGKTFGHIWVIDGYHMAAKYHYYYKRTSKVVNKKTMYSYDIYRCRAEIDMYHMKWGWGLNGNGWYASFNPWNMTGYNFERQIYLFSEIYPNL